MFQRSEHRISRRAFLQKTTLQTAALASAVWGAGRLGWWQPLSGRSASNGISGVVTDLLTGQPIAGATITASPAGESGASLAGGAVVTADHYGFYQFALPAGGYQVRASAPGYLGMARDRVIVPDGGETRVDFALLLENPTPAQQEAIYAKLALAPEGPPDGAALAMALGEEVSPAAVTVPETIWVRLPSGVVTEMDLDEYLRHVVPYEMPSSWPQEALRAQAVAARTYAVAYRATYEKPICTTTSCQVYGDMTYNTTDQAVWATHGVVATYNDSVITAFYFSRCNGSSTKNSEDAISWQNSCSRLNWNYVAYCRATPCTGHSPSTMSSCGYYGHGVGMCQWGAFYRAQSGMGYQDILRSYYTGIQLTQPPSPCADRPPQLTWPPNGYIAQAGTPISLSWTGNSASYALFGPGSSGLPPFTAGGAITSFTTPSALPAGTYYWYVTGSTGGCSAVASEIRSFRLVNVLHKQTLPLVVK